MDRALVVIDETESSDELLGEAGELAAGAGAALVIFSPLSEDAYEEDASVLSEIEAVERTSFDKQPEHLARSAADQAASEQLDDLEVEYETRGAIVDSGERATAIVDAATAADCDYVFLVGKRRSPTGKAIFGETAQDVLLNFDGRVVVTME